MSSNIVVKVVYALSKKQYYKKMILRSGTTVREAIYTSGLLKLHKDIDLTKNKIGIYGRLVQLTDKVKNQDRIEIYRPLISDPKELRRKRVKR